MDNKKIEKAQDLFLNNGSILRTSELKENKFHSREITELVNRGYLAKIDRGIYAWKDKENDLSDYALACGIIQQGVIYLYSAAAYYEFTTMNPMKVSMAVPLGSRVIKLPAYPPIELYPLSKNVNLGKEEIIKEHEIIRIYNMERTVCDFFKNRNKVGKDMMLEVVKNYMNLKSKNLQRLMEYAEVVTDKKALSTYIEALQ